ncbi:SusF/SusE family outer membrane protein [Paludibacter sp.]
MNNIVKLSTFVLVIIPILFLSCNEDLIVLNKGETKLELTVNKDDIALDILNPDANILNFEWTTGSNKGTGSAITYQFQLALDDSEFKDGLTYELGKNVTSLVFTNEALNNILLDSLNVAPNSDVIIKTRVLAKVLAVDSELQITDPITIKVRTYYPVSKTLYIIGSATPQGWDAIKATKMNSISGTPGGFVWQGRLNIGEFKFILNSGQSIPSYNKGEDTSKLHFRVQENQVDEKFQISSPGMYKITLNIINLTIQIEILDMPEYAEFWFVGGFSSWNFEQMRNDVLDPYVFHFNSDLTSPNGNAVEEFKIATAPNFDANTVYFRPQINNQGAGNNLSVVKWSDSENSNDNKWRIAPGTYKIKLDLRSMKIDIVPYTLYSNIYIVGDATPNGWDIGNATDMEKIGTNLHRFTWTGNLRAGEIKFSCDKKSDWNGGWFIAINANSQPTGSEEKMIYSFPGSNPDNKWVISEAGTYTIELDQLQEIVKFTKQ